MQLWKIHKKIKLKSVILFFISVASFQAFGQQVEWTIELDSCASASSPRLADLNGDGILDVIVGDGIFDDINNLGHVNAVDGSNGQLIWRRTVGYDKFNSALLYDLNVDSVLDVVISGRFPELLALNGLDGSTIWEFDNTTIEPPTGWKHFYNQQLLPDLNNDGLPEILASNGGEQDSLPNSITRPPGFLVVINGSDGSLVSYATVPDSAEVYCAPVVYDIDGDNVLEIVFGTGGETHPGSLWLTDLDDLLSGNIDNAVNLAQNQNKGFIGSPALADMNNDGVLDIIGSSYDGYLTVIDGDGLNELWRFEMPGGETYVTPAIGYFNGDSNLDLFMGFGIGEFPVYEKHRQFLLDGIDGSILYEDSIGFNGMSSPVAIDIDSDGFDEVYYHINIPVPGSPLDFGNATSAIRFYDFNDGQYSFLSAEEDGISWGTTPSIKDIDGDGQVELFYGFSKASGPEFADNSFELVRLNLSGTPDLQANWAAYQGSSYTSIYPLSELSVGSIQSDEVASSCVQVSNDGSENIRVEVNHSCLNTDVLLLEVVDMTGKVVQSIDTGLAVRTVYLDELKTGIYFLVLTTRSGLATSNKFFVNSND